MGKRFTLVASLIPMVLLAAALLTAGCGSETASSAPSVSPSPSATLSWEEKLAAEATAYIKAIKPVMKGEDAAFRKLIAAYKDLAKLSRWDSSWSRTVERIRSARAKLAAIEVKVAKVEAPKSMRAPQRKLERYFSLLDESIGIELKTIDAGATSQAGSDKAVALHQQAVNAYAEWHALANNASFDVFGKPLPFKTHF